MNKKLICFIIIIIIILIIIAIVLAVNFNRNDEQVGNSQNQLSMNNEENLVQNTDNTLTDNESINNNLNQENIVENDEEKIIENSQSEGEGNISVFYEDFRYSSSLYKLGTIESGTEIIGNMNGNFEVTIERVN